MIFNMKLKAGELFGRLEAIAFITGFSLMAFELVAARILAPTIGSSMYVWTSVIGVIIAALSGGYWAGGKIADARNRLGDVVWLCLLSALLVLFTFSMHRELLSAISSLAWDSRLLAIIASLLLFAPTSFVLGMVSSYLVKLKVTSLETSGQSVASLSALNSIGGIAGTFTTGFILFGYVGSRETLILVIVLLITASWLLAAEYRWKERVGVTVAALVIVAIPVPLAGGSIASIDTPSSHYEIIQTERQGRTVNALVTGPGNAQSAVYLDDPTELVFWYTQEIARLTKEKEPRSILILGGGTFTLPQHFTRTLPNTKIDVVEIDPALENVAKTFFAYEPHPNVTLFFEDARTFIRQTSKQYDLVIIDAYGDKSVPFSLMTREFGRQVASRLANDGAVLVNVIGGEKGACREILAAVDGIYRPDLPHGSYSTKLGHIEPQANYIFAYAKKPMSFSLVAELPAYNGTPYTDNFAPSDRIYFECSR